MNQLDIDEVLRPRFSIFAQAVHFILPAFDHTQVEVPCSPVSLMSRNLEGMAAREVLHSLRYVVEDLSIESYLDTFQVWRHLEIDY